jgi:hypothetical protein
VIGANQGSLIALVSFLQSCQQASYLWQLWSLHTAKTSCELLHKLSWAAVSTHRGLQFSHFNRWAYYSLIKVLFQVFSRIEKPSRQQNSRFSASVWFLTTNLAKSTWQYQNRYFVSLTCPLVECLSSFGYFWQVECLDRSYQTAHNSSFWIQSSDAQDHAIISNMRQWWTIVHLVQPLASRSSGLMFMSSIWASLFSPLICVGFVYTQWPHDWAMLHVLCDPS